MSKENKGFIPSTCLALHSTSGSPVLGPTGPGLHHGDSRPPGSLPGTSPTLVLSLLTVADLALHERGRGQARADGVAEAALGVQALAGATLGQRSGAQAHALSWRLWRQEGYRGRSTTRSHPGLGSPWDLQLHSMVTWQMSVISCCSHTRLDATGYQA